MKNSKLKKLTITLIVFALGSITARAQMPPPDWFSNVAPQIKVTFHGTMDGYNEANGTPVIKCNPSDKICFVVWLDQAQAGNSTDVTPPSCSETSDSDVYVRHYDPVNQSTSLSHYDNFEGIIENGECKYIMTNN
jgi:hypothetical protein